MKYLYITLTVLICTSTNCFSQTAGFIEHFKINGTVELNDSKSTVIQKLGIPNKELIYYNEMDSRNDLWVYYGDSYITLYDDKVTSFSIKDTNLFLQYKTIRIQCGADVSVIKPEFLDNYNLRLNSSFHQVHIPLKSTSFIGSDNLIDEFINITFDPNSDKIIEIFHGGY